MPKKHYYTQLDFFKYAFRGTFGPEHVGRGVLSTGPQEFTARPFDPEAKRLYLLLEFRDLEWETHALFNPATDVEEDNKEDKTPNYVLRCFKRVQNIILNPDNSLLDCYRSFSKLRRFCEKGFKTSKNYIFILLLIHIRSNFDHY
jgi:hypothetical protein